MAKILFIIVLVIGIVEDVKVIINKNDNNITDITQLKYPLSITPYNIKLVITFIIFIIYGAIIVTTFIYCRCFVSFRKAFAYLILLCISCLVTLGYVFFDDLISEKEYEFISKIIAVIEMLFLVGMGYSVII